MKWSFIQISVLPKVLLLFIIQHDEVLQHRQSKAEGVRRTIDLRITRHLLPPPPPTLTQINTSSSSSNRQQGRGSEKRLKQDEETNSSYHHPIGTYPHSSDHDLPFSFRETDPLSSADDTDDSNPDPLSCSFKSLYKSIFGHSVSSGEYLNPPPLPSSVLTDLGSSDSSIPLGSSAISLLGGGITSSAAPSSSDYCPHFYTLMDSFRDIAESNSWDKLEPQQVQGLMRSFRAVERDRLGLDDESYTRVSSSFQQFLQQVNCRFETEREVEEEEEDGQRRSIDLRSGGAVSHLVDRLPPTYPDHPEFFPISGASPPTTNYASTSLEVNPSSPTRPDSHHHHHQFTSVQFEPRPTSDLKYPCPTQQQQTGSYSGNNGITSIGAATIPGGVVSGNPDTMSSMDPFVNDDDDFDWSKIV